MISKIKKLKEKSINFHNFTNNSKLSSKTNLGMGQLTVKVLGWIAATVPDKVCVPVQKRMLLANMGFPERTKRKQKAKPD